MGTRFRNHETFAKIVAGVCIAVLLFADLLRDVHLLSAAHVVCVAHGELIDASEAAQSATSEPTSVTLPSGAVAHDHEHCSLAGTPTRTHADRALEVSLVSVSPSGVSVIAPIPDAQPMTVRALAYAPKQGPPA